MYMLFFNRGGGSVTQITIILNNLHNFIINRYWKGFHYNEKYDHVWGSELHIPPLYTPLVTLCCSLLIILGPTLDPKMLFSRIDTSFV